MSLTVVTYGGGEILQNVFNAVAMLMNGKTGSLYQPLMLMGASIGAVWALIRAFFTPSVDSILGKFIIPLVAIPSLLMIPTSSVHIEDVLSHRSYKVDHVPIILAKFSELVSSIGYQVTVAVEKVMHTPNDLSYNKTGMIFGSESALDTRQYRLTDANMEQNLRRFSRQCITYDIALGRYSIDELKKSTDIWKLFEEKTSKVRMIPFKSPGNERVEPIYCSCQEAVKKMKPYLDKDKSFYVKSEIYRNLPLTFQALTGMQEDAERLVSQQLIMNSLNGEFSRGKFSSARAASQQRSTYVVLGSLAGKSLITMRVVLEALIYCAFIFVMPMSLFPGGFRFIGKWMFLIVWIQLWPPFYAILNYVMQTVAQSHTQALFTNLSQSETGLSLFTTVGLRHVYEDIFALAGYLSASIPFISYAIVQGGVASFIHLAGSMMTPAHSAASIAATEETTGNYSYGNASFGQMHYKTANSFQRNYAPSLSSSHFTDNTGDKSVTYSGDEVAIRQNMSSMTTTMDAREGLVSSINNAYTEQESMISSKTSSYNACVLEASKRLLDSSERFSESKSISESLQDRSQYDVQKSASRVMAVVQEQAKQASLDSKFSQSEYAELAVRAGLGGQKMGVGVSSGISARHEKGSTESESFIERLSENEDFRKAWSEHQSYCKSGSFSENQDIQSTSSYGFSKSLDESRQHLDSISKGNSHLKQLSEMRSEVSSGAFNAGKNLTDEYKDSLIRKTGSVSSALGILKRPSTNPKRLAYEREFIDEYVGEFMNSSRTISSTSSIRNHGSAALEEARKEEIVPQVNTKSAKSQIEAFSFEKRSICDERFQSEKGRVEERIAETSNMISNKDSELSDRSELKREEFKDSKEQMTSYPVSRSIVRGFKSYFEMLKEASNKYFFDGF